MSPTATGNQPADQLNPQPHHGRIRRESDSRPMSPSRAAMTARLKRIREKLRQQHQRP
jgi:hypothetical protein